MVLKKTVWMLSVLVFAGCSAPEGFVADGSEDVVHEGSGIPFPAAHIDFVRYSTEPNFDGADGVRVRYGLSKLDDVATVEVLVYANPDADPEAKPRESTLQPSETQDAQLAIVIDEIEASIEHAEHRFIASYDVPIVRNEKPYFGKKAYFRTDDGRFLNAFVFEFGTWFVEYRSEFARDLDRDAEKFVQDHSWGEAAGAKPDQSEGNS